MPHSGIHVGRARVFGGTTTLWAGQSLPLFDIDFEPREWVPESGWPINRQMLKPYYDRAEQVLQLPQSSYDVSELPAGGLLPRYDVGSVETHLSQFTSTPSFAHKYGAMLRVSNNVTVLTHANAISLDATKDASVIQQLVVRSFSGREIIVQAKMFIVCCGGIETARLLLNSDSVEPDGVGNRHDVVGRYFQDHPGVAAEIRPIDAARLADAYDSFRNGPYRRCIKFSASAQFQREHRILHVGGEIFYPLSPDDPIEAAKLIVQSFRQPALLGQVPRAFSRVVRRPDRIARTLFNRFALGKVASVGNSRPHVGFSAEQLPNSSSRVTLSRQVDSLGMRRTTLDWRLSGAESKSISIFAEAMARQWRRLGIAEFDPDQLHLAERERGELGGFIDASHHMGTTRMGTDPKTSVVDEHCRVHGYDNLYIGSSSVFPTSGFSNPTLTILALCMRISDEVKSRISNLALATV